MARNNPLINTHTKKYVEMVFEERLRAEGFSCFDDKYLCWYRIQGKIVNSIVFYTSWNSVPVHIELGYGIHPLFCKPVKSNNAYYSDRPFEIERFSPHPIVENCPINSMHYLPYSNEIQVVAPGRDGRGLYTLDGIVLPEMNGIDSIEKSYQHHKEKLMTFIGQGSEIKPNALSSVFIDEAIYVDDKDMYPLCMQRIDNVVAIRQKCLSDKPDSRKHQIALQEWEQRRSALFDGTRDEYCTILEKRAIENLYSLQYKR